MEEYREHISEIFSNFLPTFLPESSSSSQGISLKGWVVSARNDAASQFSWTAYLFQKEMATHSSILAWRIPWTEEPGATVHGVTEADTAE